MIDLWRSDSADRIRPMVDAVHSEGSLLVVQLIHTGREQEPVMTGDALRRPVPDSRSCAHDDPAVL